MTSMEAEDFARRAVGAGQLPVGAGPQTSWCLSLAAYAQVQGALDELSQINPELLRRGEPLGAGGA